MERRPASGPLPPLSVAALAAALAAAAAGPGRLWTDIRVVAQTGSTNADVLGCAGQGAAEGLVVAAEAQTAGRGRRGRSWHSRPGAALTFSVLLRPVLVPRAAWGWVPLLAGLAAATAVRAQAGVDARLKWPNDVMVGERKLAGILAEQAGDAIAVGIGLNVAGRDGDLPSPAATSLEACGVPGADRVGLLAEILRQLEHRYLSWQQAAGNPDGCGLREEYLGLCATVGRQVRVELPGGRQLAGTAVGVDQSGQLLVSPWGAVGAPGGMPAAVSAGDVVHVR